MLFLEDKKPICHVRENPPPEFIHAWGCLGKAGRGGGSSRICCVTAGPGPRGAATALLRLSV